jgi:hypothetical protein
MDDDLVFEPALLGVWAGKDETTLVFEQSDAQSYTLIYTEKGESARFAAHLMRLGDYLFLDFYPELPETKNRFYLAHLLPVHTFGRVALAGEELRISMADAGWFQEHLTIRHEEFKKGNEREVVITAQTQRLQSFVLEHAENPKAFGDPDVYVRMR